jgi:hypothetical protein
MPLCNYCVDEAEAALPDGPANYQNPRLDTDERCSRCGYSPDDE